jgi:phage terminase Nu1 subunit (DNA packaging protein)
MHEYTINKCAEMTGRDRATLARLLRSIPADAGTPSRPLYRLSTVVNALIEHAAKPDGRRGSGDEARLANERARLAREQTEAVALKNAATRGDLIPVAAVKRSAGIIISAFRERCLSIPGKIAAACEMRSRGEIEEIVRGEIYEALDELSRPILSADPPTQDGNDEAASDDDEVGK